MKILPNKERLLVKLLKYSEEMFSGNLIVPGQLKAGENLLVGQVAEIPGGKTPEFSVAFKKGDIVYYSEYSASKIIDIGSVIRGEQSLGDAMKSEYFVIAIDDVMAYERRKGNRVFEKKLQFARSEDEARLPKIYTSGKKEELLYRPNLTDKRTYRIKKPLKK